MIHLDQDDMNQALSLTKAGRLAEATELIQRTLQSPPARSRFGTVSQPHPVSTVPEPASSTPTHRPNPLSAAAKALQRSLGSSLAGARGLQIPEQSPDTLVRHGPRSDSLGEGCCSTECMKTIRAPGDTRSTFPRTPNDMLQSLSCCMAARSRCSTTPQGPA